MPVGALNSPKTSLNTADHSPVVTPALAAAIDGSIKLLPLFAASIKSFNALSTTPWSLFFLHC